jgi:glycerol dehydrogenase-like iron-containing ADH family enzyme
MSEIHVVCSRDAIDQFVAYCNTHGHKKFFMVCDHNTYPILGKRAEEMLKAQGADVKVIRLTGKKSLPMKLT